jgi:hypothetical protein
VQYEVYAPAPVQVCKVPLLPSEVEVSKKDVPLFPPLQKTVGLLCGLLTVLVDKFI